MTTEAQEGLRPGSFKGVPFLMRKDKTARGSAVAYYDYINTEKRIGKPLGGIPPIFTSNIETHGLTSDYFDRRDALVDALDPGESGPLVHPFWGGPFNVSVSVYEVEQDISRIGVCSFNVVFRIVEEGDDSPTVPADRISNPAQSRNLANTALGQLADASADAFLNSSPSNFESSVGTISASGNSLKDSFAKLGQSIKKVSDYAGKALQMVEKASFYADNPLILFSDLADNVLGVDGLTLDVFAKFQACKALFNFGDSGSTYSNDISSPIVLPTNPRTNEDAQRVKNADVMATFMQSSSTMEAYAQLGNLTFDTVQDIDDAESQMDGQFEVISDRMTPNPEAQIYEFNVPEPDYSDTFDTLTRLRTSVRQYLDQQRLTSARIETIKIAPEPASVLAYRLYQDSTRSDNIMDLRGTRDNMALSGDVEVLSK